jgi:carboxymethylenebutenolidase
MSDPREHYEHYNEDVTRRRFLGGAAAAAAGVAAAAAGAPAAAQRKALDDPAVATEKVTFKSGDQAVDGFLARPMAPGRHPAILVIPGIFGVTEYMRESAAQLAQNGFAALDVNLFARTPEAGGLTAIDQLRPIVDRMPDAQILGDLQAGIDYLKRQAFVRGGGVGVVGFCMGGKYALLLTARSGDVRAAVPFYGPVTQPAATPARPAAPADLVKAIRVPVQGHYGRLDTGIPVADVERLERELREQGTTAQFFIYDQAGHAFHDYSRAMVYNAPAARLAWSRTIEFFKKHLSDSGP